MTERLLQFIWQFQYFNKNQLLVHNGEQLQLIHPGTYNIHQGPDFTQARIKIDKTVFAGSIELHVKTSDWDKHKHTEDQNYRNVILHVVWEHDTEMEENIPVLVLNSRVPLSLLKKYEQWMQQPAYIPCNRQITDIAELIWTGWKDRLLAERLVRKAGTIQQYLYENNYHWEETFWWLLARHFGTNVNASAFEAVARSIPFTVLSKKRAQIHQVEALLLGQAGLLNKPFKEDYPCLLKNEYEFLRKKYKLTQISEAVFFLRMRPVNFPTIRLAQLAMLLHRSTHLFAQVKQTGNIKKVKEMMEVTANDYWHYHYIFDEETPYIPKNTGIQMIDTLLINAVCPLLFTYGVFMNDSLMKKKALDWLSEIAAEKNGIINGFAKLGITTKNASDSQSLLELKTQYCDKKRCLDCSVGNALLKHTIQV